MSLACFVPPEFIAQKGTYFFSRGTKFRLSKRPGNAVVRVIPALDGELYITGMLEIDREKKETVLLAEIYLRKG
jgi:hypothetical protein